MKIILEDAVQDSVDISSRKVVTPLIENLVSDSINVSNELTLKPSVGEEKSTVLKLETAELKSENPLEEGPESDEILMLSEVNDLEIMSSKTDNDNVEEEGSIDVKKTLESSLVEEIDKKAGSDINAEEIETEIRITESSEAETEYKSQESPPSDIQVDDIKQLAISDPTKCIETQTSDTNMKGSSDENGSEVNALDSQILGKCDIEVDHSGNTGEDKVNDDKIKQ